MLNAEPLRGLEAAWRRFAPRAACNFEKLILFSAAKRDFVAGTKKRKVMFISGASPQTPTDF